VPHDFEQADLRKVTTISITARKRKVRLGDFARIYDPRRESFRSFVLSFPRILRAADLKHLVNDVVQAHRRRKPVILFVGAHVIKVGLSPLLVDLLRKKVITCIAMNGAAAIHDVETALFGTTSEDVEENIADGSVGMSRETGEFINGAVRRAFLEGTAGFGGALGNALQKARNRKLSLLAECWRLQVPATVHVAIGTDIIHQQPSMDGASTGELSFRDFRILCAVVKKLGGGGVAMNVGSAVVLPEVFLKALTVARNLGSPVRDFTTANFDMLQQYRPSMNVVQRPVRQGGTGYSFTGHHEIMIPLVCAMIKERLTPR
jgi:hypothetical protein